MLMSQRQRSRQKRRNQGQGEEDDLSLQKIDFYLERLKTIDKNNRDENKGHLKVEYRLPLLKQDEKQKFPHSILYQSFNFKLPQKYNLDGRYIPGNSIHRQFSAYYKFFINQYLIKQKYQVINDLKVRPEELDQLQQLINFTKDKTQLRQYQNLLEDYEKESIKNNKQIEEATQKLSLYNEKRYFIQLKIQGLIDRNRKKKQNIYDEIGQRFKQLESNYPTTVKLDEDYLEQNFQKIEEMQEQYLKAKSRGEISDQIQKLRQRIHEYQMKQKDLKYLFKTQNYTENYPFTEKQTKISSLPNFGMGRLSFVNQKLKELVIFQPFENFTNSTAVKVRENYHIKKRLKAADQNYSHSERQIIECAKEKIEEINNYKGENKEYQNFQKSKIIVLDIFSERSTCSGTNTETKKFCRNKIPSYKVECIEKESLKQGQQLFIRVSYHKAFHTDKQMRENHELSFKDNQRRGNFIQHLVHIPKEGAEINYQQICFKRKHMFKSSYHEGFYIYCRENQQQLYQLNSQIIQQLEKVKRIFKDSMKPPQKGLGKAR